MLNIGDSGQRTVTTFHQSDVDINIASIRYAMSPPHHFFSHTECGVSCQDAPNYGLASVLVVILSPGGTVGALIMHLLLVVTTGTGAHGHGHGRAGNFISGHLHTPVPVVHARFVS